MLDPKVSAIVVGSYHLRTHFSRVVAITKASFVQEKNDLEKDDRHVLRNYYILLFKNYYNENHRPYTGSQYNATRQQKSSSHISVNRQCRKLSFCCELSSRHFINPTTH